ncbi:MAG: hypothetical protein Q7K44_04815 [Candidatus Liptonbacteria bacterium]|nr:hypothetical protein [Candidatus Liptonbacteria bacterium]
MISSIPQAAGIRAMPIEGKNSIAPDGKLSRTIATNKILAKIKPVPPSSRSG